MRNKYIIIAIFIFAALPIMSQTKDIKAIEETISHIDRNSVQSGCNYANVFMYITDTLRLRLKHNDKNIARCLLKHLHEPEKCLAIQVLLTQVYAPDQDHIFYKFENDTMMYNQYNGLRFEETDHGAISIKDDDILPVIEYWTYKLNDSYSYKKSHDSDLCKINWDWDAPGHIRFEAPGIFFKADSMIPYMDIEKFDTCILAGLSNKDKVISTHMALTRELMFNDYLNHFIDWATPTIDGNKLLFDYNGFRFEYDKQQKKLKTDSTEVNKTINFWKNKIGLNALNTIPDNNENNSLADSCLEIYGENILPHIEIDSMLITKYAKKYRNNIRKLLYYIIDDDKTVVIHLILSKLFHEPINENCTIERVDEGFRIHYANCTFYSINGKFYITWQEISRIRRYWEAVLAQNKALKNNKQ